jgi:hypothetical protein
MTKKEINRLNELYEMGVSRYLENSEVDIVGEWLEEKEQREYQKLHFKMDSQCVICGNPEIMYWCKNCEDNRDEAGCIHCGAGKHIVIDKNYHNNC